MDGSSEQADDRAASAPDSGAGVAGARVADGGSPGRDYLDELAVAMRHFSEARGWTHLQTPKNLAMALTGEAGELAAEFQWLTGDGSERPALSPERLTAIESEMADVLIYLVQLADRLGTSLPDAVAAKMAINETRFPPLSS